MAPLNHLRGMDCSCLPPYVQSRMNLLLLLSALFSALSGLGGSARTPASVQAVAGAAAAQVVAPARQVATTLRPVAALPDFAALARSLVAHAAFALTPATPLWADRRRE